MVLQHDWAGHPGVMALSGTSPFLDRMGGSPCCLLEAATVPSHTNGSRPHPPPMRAACRLLSFLSTLRDRCRDGTAE